MEKESRKLFDLIVAPHDTSRVPVNKPSQPSTSTGGTTAAANKRKHTAVVSSDQTATAYVPEGGEYPPTAPSPLFSQPSDSDKAKLCSRLVKLSKEYLALILRFVSMKHPVAIVTKHGDVTRCTLDVDSIAREPSVFAAVQQ